MLEQIFECYYYLNNNNEDEIYSLLEEVRNIKIHKLLNINPLFKNQFVLFIFKKNNSIFINILHKNFDPFSDKKWLNIGNYKMTIILDTLYDLEEPYDWYNIEKEYELIDLDEEDNEQNSEEVEDEEITSNEEEETVNNDMIDLMVSLSDILYDTYYQNSISNEINLDESYNFVDGTSEIYDLLYNNLDGLYFNPKDIRWQIALKELLSSYIGNNGKNIKYVNYKNYNRKTMIETYYKNFNKNSIYEKYIYNHTEIVCDLCNNIINKEPFYHTSEAGDLCDKCFIIKKKSDIKKQQKYWKMVLNEGKKIVFKKDLIKTKKYLENHKIIELPLLKKYTISKKINNLLIINKKYTCGICLNNMCDNIYSGQCGHCFHYECIEEWNHLECPICRTPTYFIKLYI